MREVIASQLQSTSLELGMAQTELFGLQTSLRNETNSIGNLVRQTTALMDTPAYRERYANAQMVQIQSIQQRIAARDARFEIDTPMTEISQYSVNSTNQNTAVKFDLKKGDLISVEISGQYSPTCALAKEYNNLHGLETARTGPEGFSVSESDRRLIIESSSASVVDQDTGTHTRHLERCGSSTLGHSISVTGGFTGTGVEYSKNWFRSTPEDCADAITSNAHSIDHSDARTHSSSAELVQNASFEKGLRSSFAPFPSIPVGALVAVERDPISGRMIRKHVLHRLSTLSAVNDAELYLVVNDCRSTHPNSASLQVSITQKRSPINPGVISYLMESINIVSETMQTKLSVYIDQGDLVPTESNTIKNQLKELLDQKLISNTHGAFQIADFPLIHDMINNWLQTEVTQLERRIKIRQTERKIQLLLHKYTELRNQMRNIERESVIRGMVSDAAFRSLDLKVLIADVLQTVKLLDYRILPSVKTLYPTVIDETQAYTVQFLTFLRSLKLDVTLDEVSTGLIEYLDAIHFEQIFQNPRRSDLDSELVISFPRTFPHENGADGKYIRRVDNNNQVTYESTSHFQSVPFAEASRVWNAFANREEEISLRVDLNDIYAKHFLVAALNCRQMVPIVKAMGIVFVLDNPQYQDALNILELQTHVTLPSEVLIPTAIKLDVYQNSSPDFREAILPVRFSTPYDALRVFNETIAPLQRARGISPVGTFTIPSMRGFYTHPSSSRTLDQIEEILLVFQYDSIGSSVPLDWIPKCRSDN